MTDPEDVIKRVEASYSADRFDECLQVLREALNQPLPDLDRARLLTALGWYVSGIRQDFTEAISLGEQAVALAAANDNNRALALQALALMMLSDCFESSDPERSKQTAQAALAMFARARKANAEMSKGLRYDLCVNASRLNGMLGDLDLALQMNKLAFEFSIDVKRRGECLTAQGMILREQGKLDEAREKLRQAIALMDGQSEYPLAWQELGATEEAMGKLPEARAKLQKALSLLREDRPSDLLDRQSVTARIADISFQLGDYEGAAEWYRVLAGLYSPDEPMHWNAFAWESSSRAHIGQFTEAAAILQRIADAMQAPEEERAKAVLDLRTTRLEEIKAHYNRADYAAYVEQCRQLLPEISPGSEDHVSAVLLLGHAYLGLRNKAAARKCYETLVNLPTATARQVEIAKRCLAERC
jgi:tetratricopeptide (TPR) repeat protein